MSDATWFVIVASAGLVVVALTHVVNALRPPQWLRDLDARQRARDRYAKAYRRRTQPK